jgi:hypothetical protein
MKKIILILILGLFAACINSFAQCSIRTITTKWDAPGTNNTFNWSNSFYNNVYIKNRTSTTIASPFYNPFSTYQNPTLIFLQSPTTKDLQPDDGWELLVKDFGTNQNLPSTAVTNPFFALYNRYTGVVRAFFLVIDPLAGNNNGATMSLMFEGGDGRVETSLLAHANPVVKPLDQFEKGIVMRMPNKYANENDYWLFADFPVSYDPCTCFFGSLITFTVQLIETTNATLAIKLEGSSTGTIKEIIKAAPDGVQVNTNSNSIMNWVGGITKSGAEGYKDFQKYETASKNIGTFLIKNISAKDKLDQQLAGFTAFTKNIPYVGAVVGVFDFLIAGGKKEVKSAGPMASSINLKHDISGSANGKLELSTVRGYRTITTPGSNIANVSSGIPTYDNILGIFSLIETPKIEYLLYSRDQTSENIVVTKPNPNYDPNCMPSEDNDWCNDNPETLSSYLGVYDHKLVQYKVTSPIKYAINPAAKMDLIDIKAALVIDKSNDTYGNYIVPTTFGNLASYTNEIERYNVMGYEYETEYKYRTAFVPLSCLSNTSIMASLQATYSIPFKYPKDVYIKIQATFRRQDATSTTQDVIFVSTYKTSISQSSQDPGNLKFKNMNTGRTDPNGYSLAPYEFPNTYYKTASQLIFPLPIPNIAGIANPSYPSICSSIVEPQTASQLTAFCNDLTKYNPFANSRHRMEDEIRSQSNSEYTSLTDNIKLSNNPNPFNNLTTITFNLNKASKAKLIINDQNGRILNILINKELPAGNYSYPFNSQNLSSGVYYYTLELNDKRVTNKMIIIK